MPKIALSILILPLVFPPLALVLAQETSSSTGTVNPAFELPTGPLDGLINEWVGGGKLKNAVQQGMNQAQSGLQEAAGQALGSAQDTAKNEINKQVSLAVQGLKQKAEAYIGEGR